MDFPLEQWRLAHSDSGLGHQWKGLRCGLLSMEYCTIGPKKNQHGQVLGFPPLLKCKVWWRQDYVAAQQNQPGYDQGKASLDQWPLSIAFHNHRSRADSTLPPTVEMLRKENRRVLSERTISDLRRCCISLCGTRESNPSSGLQGASIRVWHLCNEG